MLRKLIRKRKTKAPVVSRTEFLKAKPLRNPSLKWEKDEKGIIDVIVPPKQKQAKKGVPSKMLSNLFPSPAPSEKRVHLDKIGSMIWEMCNGKTTVKMMVNILQEKFKVMPVEAEVQLETYLRQLSERGLIGMLFPEKPQDKMKQDKEAAK